MKYMIYLGEGDEPILLSHPVSLSSETYLREVVLPAMGPLSDNEYSNGTGKLLSTAAHSSYVLEGENVSWCIECQPGLVVVKFSPDGSVAQVALPSPNPEFGGREASAEEIANFDEDAENPQYNLIFDAWDAQFEEEEELDEWDAVDVDTKRQFETALAHADLLGKRIAEVHGQQRNQ